MSAEKYQFSYVPSLPPGTLKTFIWSVIKRDPWMWLWLLVSDVVHHIRYPIAFFMVGYVVNSLGSLPEGSSLPQSLWWAAFAIFLVLFVGELAHFFASYSTIRWFGWMRPQIRADLMDYVLHHSYQYLQDNFAGALSRKITEATESTLRLNDNLRYHILAPLISMFFIIISVLAFHPFFSVAVLVFVLSVILPVLFSLKVIHEKSRAYSEARSLVTGQVVDSIANAISVKSFARNAHEIKRHNKLSAPEIKGWMKLTLKMVQIETYRRLCLVLFGSGMMVLSLYMWQSDLVSLGDIAAIMGMTFSMTAGVWALGHGFVQAVDHFGYISDALGSIVRPHDVMDQDDASELRISDGVISFSSVDFSFTDQPVFQGLSLDIRPQEHIGLIGASGAGKSTLISLLLRYFDVSAGRIMIDGQNIVEVTQDSLRANIAVIPQDTSLFHRSLMENIRYGCLEASDAQVIEAAKKAHAHEFISALPEGYATLVGERGVKLSGGQRQRIAIARAILKDAPILILDEATSALDSESEKFIQDSLQELMAGKTVIAIAHRLSTIAHLDRLIVMDQGRIVEDGSHDDLLQAGGTYAKLWSMQSGGFLGE